MHSNPNTEVSFQKSPNDGKIRNTFLKRISFNFWSSRKKSFSLSPDIGWQHRCQIRRTVSNKSKAAFVQLGALFYGGAKSELGEDSNLEITSVQIKNCGTVERLGPSSARTPREFYSRQCSRSCRQFSTDW